MTTAALVACLGLAALAVLQLGLATGRPWGELAWGGSHRVLPTGLRAASAASVLLYALFALVILHSAGIVDVLPETAGRWALWVLTAYLGLGIVANALSRSRAERWVMTPTVALLFGCCLLLALAQVQRRRSLWLLAFAVLLVRRPRTGDATATQPAPSGVQR